MKRSRHSFRILLFIVGVFSFVFTGNRSHAQTLEKVSIGLTGDSIDVKTKTEFGVVLMGGSTDVDEALKWMIKKSGGGDFVIIRASGATGYNDYIKGLGDVNSVETLLIDSREKALRKSTSEQIRNAEALFIAGGDQNNYVKFWKDTEVSKAIQYLIDVKKVPVGGTSAGCAILSEYIFDASKGSVTSGEAMFNPYDTLVSVSKSFIAIPFLTNIIADQHYSQRNRQGRHVTFMARMSKDFGVRSPKGIGVDEKTALCIDDLGNMKLFGKGTAYFLSAESLPEQCEQRKKLFWEYKRQAIQVVSFQATSEGTAVFNIKAWPEFLNQYWYVRDGVLFMR
jgi:cyanophycinase